MSRTGPGLDDELPGAGAYLGPLCGDVDTAAAQVEARAALEQVTVTLSRTAAEDYVRYGVESAPYDVWRAISDALERRA